MTARRLTFYLFREEVTELEEALDAEKRDSLLEATPTTEIVGKFYYVEPRPSTPSWVRFVQPILGDALGALRSSSTSAVLLLKARGRIFALTFGYGRALIDLSKIEYQFGLRVALNRIDPRQIRSLDTKTFEDLVVSVNTQASKSSELPTFGVDVSKDILRAVTGEPRDASFAKRLAGSDSLVINRELDARDLPVLCAEILTAFEADDYKENFGWIDQLAIVRDLNCVGELNDLLLDQMKSGSIGATHLAMPEAIGWEDIDAFKIGGTRRQEYEDLELEEYLYRLGASRSSLTLENLKSRPVSVRFGRSGNFDKRWSLYQCIVSEQRLDEKLYVLMEGRWFAVNETLVEEIDQFISTLPESSVGLLDAASGEIESLYNDRVAQSRPAALLKLDARIKRPGGAASGIEFCDLLSRGGEIIHVKRKSRSSTLSHLFAQGSVSATTFLSDGHFRDEIRAVIENDAPAADRDAWLDLIPASDQPLDRSRYCVTFAVIANSARAGRDWLPFFSKLNLMQQGRQLISMGLAVAVSRVSIVP